MKAFRDTWRDGIHSYLTYLRDRLTVARDLLNESGSVFVQIGDENVHRVRALMDEVFGEDNLVSVATYAKTTGFSGSHLSSVCDHLIWYAKSISNLKYRALFDIKAQGGVGASKYRPAATIKALEGSCVEPTRLATSDQLTSQGASVNSDQSFHFGGREWTPPAGLHWKTTVSGLNRLSKAGRVVIEGRSIRYIRFLDDFSVSARTNIWLDVGGVQSRTDPKVYVVQTATEAVKRCICMTTDPGDLVLDPTCGSGTTAYVAEQWGRRWITIDTSRVALALARARIMGARYPWYLLADSIEGQRREAEITQRSNSQNGASGLGGVEPGSVCKRMWEGRCSAIGVVGQRSRAARPHVIGRATVASLARRSLVAGLRKDPLAGWLAGCVRRARKRPPGERTEAGVSARRSRTGRSSCRSRTTP